MKTSLYGLHKSQVFSCSITGWHRPKTLAPLVLRHYFSTVLPFRTIYVSIKNIFDLYLIEKSLMAY